MSRRLVLTVWECVEEGYILCEPSGEAGVPGSLSCLEAKVACICLGYCGTKHHGWMLKQQVYFLKFWSPQV
jgi:hypothetical protein